MLAIFQQQISCLIPFEKVGEQTYRKDQGGHESYSHEKKEGLSNKNVKFQIFILETKICSIVNGFFKGEIFWGPASFSLGQFVSFLSWLVRSSLENSGFVWKR